MALLTPHWTLDVVVVLLSAFFAAYLYMTRNFDYWKKKGVLQVTPTPFLGNLSEPCLLRRTFGECLQSLYDGGKGEPYMGFYIFDKPALMLRDPEIIKRVLIKDFNKFSDRYVSTDESDTIGLGNLLILKNPRWKHLRAKITPFFTSGKMKNMFPLMAVVGEELVTHLDNLGLQGDGKVINTKETCARYAMDVISTCALGLQSSCLNDPNSLFSRYGKLIFGFSTVIRSAEFAAFFFAPFLVKLLKLKFFSEKASNFLRKTFDTAMDQRIESNTRRNDLIDLLREMKKSQDENNEPDAFKLEGDAMVGQAATFFAAGFETSSTAMSFSFYELAQQPKLQSRLREEIHSALAKSGEEVTYEMVMNLPYLDMVVSETLRKYSSLPFLDRVAACDYKIPDHDLMIEKGTPVYISLIGLHYDPEHFPDPEKYDPERFSSENKRNIRTCTYLPFGEGPRICIGLRFALLLTKLGVFKFIQNYEVALATESSVPMRFEPQALLLKSTTGVLLNVRRIDPDGSR